MFGAKKKKKVAKGEKGYPLNHNIEIIKLQTNHNCNTPLNSMLSKIYCCWCCRNEILCTLVESLVTVYNPLILINLGAEMEEDMSNLWLSSDTEDFQYDMCALQKKETGL